MIVVSLLPHVKFRRNDHREDAPHFIQRDFMGTYSILFEIGSSTRPISEKIVQANHQKWRSFPEIGLNDTISNKNLMGTHEIFMDGFHWKDS